jgi:DNA-binding FadR family transcriptional regulator
VRWSILLRDRARLARHPYRHQSPSPEPSLDGIGERHVTTSQASTVLEPFSGALPPLETVAPIPKEQLYEKLSKAIIDQVLSGSFVPGQRLPAERDLARSFGVSRPSLREALGALQTLGVVETRHGSGSWISSNALDVLADHPQGVIDLGERPVMLLEARAIVEPSIASLAAERYAPDPELDRLLALMDAARDWEDPSHRMTWSEADRLFHQRLAVHTHNAVLIIAADAISSVQAQPLWRRLRDDSFTVAGRITRAIDEHEEIFKAVSSGAPEAAAAAARNHIGEVRDSMLLE